MPKSKASEAIQSALVLMTWRVIQQLFKLRHIPGTPKSADVVDPKKFLTKDDKLKKSEVKKLIQDDDTIKNHINTT